MIDPRYVPPDCCYKDPLEIRNHIGFQYSPDVELDAREHDLYNQQPRYLFTRDVSWPHEARSVPETSTPSAKVSPSFAFIDPRSALITHNTDP